MTVLCGPGKIFIEKDGEWAFIGHTDAGNPPFTFQGGSLSRLSREGDPRVLLEHVEDAESEDD